MYTFSQAHNAFDDYFSLLLLSFLLENYYNPSHNIALWSEFANLCPKIVMEFPLRNQQKSDSNTCLHQIFPQILGLTSFHQQMNFICNLKSISMIQRLKNFWAKFQSAGRSDNGAKANLKLFIYFSCFTNGQFRKYLVKLQK